MHLGEMLDRTRADVGSDVQVYAQADALEFCSAVISRRMVEADPANMVFCPFTVSAYVLPDEPGVTYVAYRKPTTLGDASSQTQAVMGEVEAMLDAIARAAGQ
jgi:hypothetical protein